MPIHSWRSEAVTAQPPSPPLHADHGSAASQPQRLSSPFQALSQYQYAPASSSELATQPGCLLPLPDLCNSLEDISQLTDSTPSSLSCSTHNSYPAMHASLMERHPTAPAAPTRELFPAYSLPSAASDPLTLPPVYISPSNSLPAACTQAVQAGSMETPPMEVTLSLSAAPAAFARPIRINKHLSPFFRVGVTCLLTFNRPYALKTKTLGVFNTSCSVNLLDACGADLRRTAYCLWYWCESSLKDTLEHAK